MPSRYDTIGGIVLSYGKLSMPGLWNLLELLRMLSRLLLVIKRTYSRVVNVWLSLLMMFSPNCFPPHVPEALSTPSVTMVHVCAFYV